MKKSSGGVWAPVSAGLPMHGFNHGKLQVLLSHCCGQKFTGN